MEEREERFYEPEDQEVWCQIVSSRNDKETSLTHHARTIRLPTQESTKITPKDIVILEGKSYGISPLEKELWAAKEFWRQEKQSFPGMSPIIGYQIPNGQP